LKNWNSGNNLAVTEDELLLIGWLLMNKNDEASDIMFSDLDILLFETSDL
jgi:hypothetical protein